jgi:Domain of unknown function (DUF4386)
MEGQPTISSQRKAARVAGLSYLLTTAIIIYSYFGIGDKLVVTGNVEQTAKNILGHESLFRLTIIFNMLYCAGLIVVLTAFYIILKAVNHGLALLAALLRFVFALVFISSALNLFTALRLITGGDYLQVFETNRLQALARLYLSGMDAYYVGLLFWSLASTICAYLWFKSRYVPRLLSAFGIISSLWCIACTIAYIIYPDFAETINLWWFDTGMVIFEIILSFWLLFGKLSGMKE